MPVTVYSKPACVQCTATCKELERQGIPYTVVNLLDDAEAYERVAGLGYRQAPVVMVGDEHWSGFRPDLIATIEAPTNT